MYFRNYSQFLLFFFRWQNFILQSRAYRKVDDVFKYIPGKEKERELDEKKMENFSFDYNDICILYIRVPMLQGIRVFIYMYGELKTQCKRHFVVMA